MIEIAGGITDRSAYQEFCKSPAADGICKSPPEFPDLLEQFNKLDKMAKDDPELTESLRHEKESHRDPRVRAVFAITPALGPAFPAAGLKNIRIPVQIVAGTADDNVPVASSAKYFASHIRGLQAGAARRRRAPLRVSRSLHPAGAPEASASVYGQSGGGSRGDSSEDRRHGGKVFRHLH
jgi:predicted dienelactone hydrolase